MIVLKKSVCLNKGKIPMGLRSIGILLLFIDKILSLGTLRQLYGVSSKGVPSGTP